MNSLWAHITNLIKYADLIWQIMTESDRSLQYDMAAEPWVIKKMKTKWIFIIFQLRTHKPFVKGVIVGKS